jgi:hypothetical protein
VLKRAAILLVAAGSAAMAAGAPAPGCGLVPGWTQQGAVRSYTADNLFEYMDGNAEGYLLYGFVNMRGVTCEKAGATFVVDVSEYIDRDSAYGMWTANRDARQAFTTVGAGGQILPRRLTFVKGVYYVEIAAAPEGDHSAALRQWATALEKTVEGSTEPPAALKWFPEGRRQSLRLVPESVLGIRALKRGYFGQYEYGKAFVVVEESVESAAAVMGKLKARFAESSAVTIGDEAFQKTDQYLGKLCFFRKGKYIGGWANVEGDAVALAGALVKALP